MTTIAAVDGPMGSFKDEYWNRGHATLPRIFSESQMDEAIADAMAWFAELVPGLQGSDRAKALEGGSAIPRWIDNPVLKRPFFRSLAAFGPLVEAVESLVGRGVDVYFSQVFFKPPEIGSPKPAHQDNFYAGPNNPDGLVTAWIALDEASLENGCLYFVDGSHRGPIFPHTAPPDQPFHLQVGEADLVSLQFSAAPVPKGGVSFHHGGTIHRSSANLSSQWRRAVAITYVTKDTYFGDPKLNYDSGSRVAISENR